MGFENGIINANGREKKMSLYRERSFSSVDEDIERLRKIETGKIKCIELSENEKKEILSFENDLGEQLEDIYDIKINSLELVPAYFLTEEGRDFFQSYAGFECEGGNEEEIKFFIIRNRARLGELDGKSISELSGKSKLFAEDRMVEKLMSSITEEGKIDFSGAECLESISLLSNPKEAFEKIIKLRSFKKDLKEEQIKDNVDQEDSIAAVNMAKSKICSLYNKRVNELICEQCVNVARIKSLADIAGEDVLSEEEKLLLKQYHGMNNFLLTYSRFDRFINGAGSDYNERGNLMQIDEKLEQYTVEMEGKYLENETEKSSKAQEKGLDFNKLSRNFNIPKEKFAEFAERLLEKYGQKSSQPSDEFDPKRKGPAPDDKWQFVARDQYKNMEVNGKQKVIKAPTRERTAEDLVSVLLGHEAVHFLQVMNQEKLPLRLYQKVLGDRRLIMSEGGAMLMQDKVSRELFGYGVYPKPHYIKAMLTRLRGGNYIDCVKSYYESSLNAFKINPETEEMDKEKFNLQVRKLLETAIRSTKRLFKPGEVLSSKPGLLSSSGASVYLEQFIVMEKLKESGFEKYAFVRGLNLQSMAELMEAGLLDVNDMEKMDLTFICELWSEISDKYKLEN